MAHFAMEDEHGKKEQAHASCSEYWNRDGQSGSQSSKVCESRIAGKKRARRYIEASRCSQAPITENRQAPETRPELDWRRRPRRSNGHLVRASRWRHEQRALIYDRRG